MLGRLIVITGPDQGRVFGIPEGGPYLIGRSGSTATQLSDLCVSRTHCRIDFDRGTLRLTDIGSRRGTYVNGERVFEHELRSGDLIRIGATELRFLSEPAESPASPRRSEPAEPESIPQEPVSLNNLTGRNLAHFAIRHSLASGSMGTVFLADDLKQARSVALKVFSTKVCRDEEEVQRLLGMMRLMASFEHPNIVQIYEADRTGGACWTSMEYVDGESLTQLIRRTSEAGMLDWRYSFRVAVQVARAIQAAHARGIIHRNIAPSNILVRVSDQVVKLGDFVFAKAMGGTGTNRVSQIGGFTGDVFYTSPERTDQTRESDTRSDIYGLGATVYALLTGRPPCDGETLTEVIEKIRYARPESPAKYQSAIPEEFAEAVLRMLEKRRADRYQAPDDLLADLDRIGQSHCVAL
jgi:serine/threonine-protein kinase